MEDYKQLFWQKQLMAAYNVLQTRGVLVSDEFRRKVEEMDKHVYDASSFYGRRLDSIANLLIEKSVITEQELRERTQAILSSGSRDHVK